MTISVCSTTVGQNYSQTLIDSFCNTTIEFYYTEFTKPLDSAEAVTFKPNNQFILKSDITKKLKTQYNHFTVYFLTEQEALEKFCLTKNRTGNLNKIIVTQLKDTVNIDINGWAIKVTKVKFKNGRPIPVHSNFAASCGGTLGYIPTCRFVFDKATSTWTKYTWTEIADAIMK